MNQRDQSRTTMETFTGRWFNFAAMRPRDICLPDIAQALSLTCRFGGHMPYFYSVAQHAMLVAYIVEYEYGMPELALAALHHDSHEAYVGDVPTPLKNTFGPAYQSLVRRIDDKIAEALGLVSKDFDADGIHEADTLALRIEAAVLKRSGGIDGAWAFRELPENLTKWQEQGWVVDDRKPDEIARAFIARDTALRTRNLYVKSYK